jgi:hypothetical protein
MLAAALSIDIAADAAVQFIPQPCVTDNFTSLFREFIILFLI